MEIMMMMMMMMIGLVTLLRLVWIAATLPIILASLPFSCLSSFRQLLLGFGQRGKIMQSSSYKFTVPQRFFLHFYSLAVAWTTLLLSLIWFYAYSMAPLNGEQLSHSTIASHLTGGSHILSFHKSKSMPVERRFMVWRSVFLLLLMEFQVLRRFYETLYVFKYSPSAQMHIVGYLTGLFFYIAAPPTFCCTYAPEVLQFATNRMVDYIAYGKEKTLDVDLDLWEFVSPLTKLGWCQWIGATIFIWGWIHQYRCHCILGKLRKRSEQIEEYIIPHGDWFEYVSSPHYLAEIVLYAGVLIASGGADLTIWLLFAFVVTNLTFTAGDTHSWYLRKFDNYPKNRQAIVPLMY